MSATPAPDARPRTLTAAFWCWVAAGVLTAALGLLLATQSGTGTALFIQLAGVLLVGVGVAQGYLAGRLRKGNRRLAAAGVGLAMATILLLAFLLLFGASVIGIAIVAVIMILLITGSAMNQRPASQQWYDGQVAA